MSWIQLIGFIAGISFACSSLPLAWETLKHRKSPINQPFLMWTVWAGAVLMYVYICIALRFDWMVTMDYMITIIDWAIVIWFYYFPNPKGVENSEAPKF